jgi:toxin ParE1/3/4
MALYRLSALATIDIIDALAWSDVRFGEVARRRYEALIVTALHDVAADPLRPGSIGRPELGADVRSYHLSSSRQRARTVDGIVHRPRHLLLYRPIRADVIGIGRVLHDAMEIHRHLPTEFGDERIED